MTLQRVFVLLTILLFVTIQPNIKTHAQDDVPSGCGTSEITCNDIFGNSGGRFTISNIRATSDIPIYANPILTLTLEIENRPSASTWRLFTSLNSYRPEVGGYCQIIIVGLADNQNQYIPYYEVKPTDNIINLNLFGFCRDMNLPGTVGEANRFPDANFTIPNINNFSPLQSPDKPDDLTSLVQRATAADNPCAITSGIASLLAQFAVYILYTAEDDRETIWQDFQINARNPLFGTVESDTRVQIYCLLDNVSGGIPTPAPTPSPTATSSPTAIPAVVITNTPQPTDTPIPFQDLPANALPLLTTQPRLTNGQILTLSFTILVGGMLLIAIWLSITPRRRRLWLIGMVAMGFLFMYFLFNPSGFLRESDTANATQVPTTLDIDDADTDGDSATPTP